MDGATTGIQCFRHGGGKLSAQVSNAAELAVDGYGVRVMRIVRLGHELQERAACARPFAEWLGANFRQRSRVSRQRPPPHACGWVHLRPGCNADTSVLARRSRDCSAHRTVYAGAWACRLSQILLDRRRSPTCLHACRTSLGRITSLRASAVPTHRRIAGEARDRRSGGRNSAADTTGNGSFGRTALRRVPPRSSGRTCRDSAGACWAPNSKAWDSPASSAALC